MSHPARAELVRRLLVQPEGSPPQGACVGEVPSARYTSREQFEREQSALFARLPVIVAHDGELSAPGSCLAVEVAGVPLIVIRDEEGGLGAFRNACRHRSTQLLSGDAPCRRKAIVCPYHGWTYDLHGRVIHVPHVESFQGKEGARRELVRAHAQSAYGFVWAGLAPFDLCEYLGPIGGDIASLGAATSTLYRRTVREVKGNWKLIVDAFLDGYHIRHLHRDSIYRFFLDARLESERVGPHIRSMVARRAMLEVKSDGYSLEEADLRRIVTPSYLVFPCTIFIQHPDYLSVLTATPLAPDRTRFVHTMLIPEPPRSQTEQAHWAKSFTLIDEGVFEGEDLAVVEAVQRGLESGANESLLFGELESAVLWFHESVERAARG